jgi:hypothetical protein
MTTTLTEGRSGQGIVFATDAAISRKVQVKCELPESLTGPVRYAIVLVQRDHDASAAMNSFYHWPGCRLNRRCFFSFALPTSLSHARMWAD